MNGSHEEKAANYGSDPRLAIAAAAVGLGATLIAAQARIALVARTADDLEAAAAKLREEGAAVFTIPADVGNREQASDAVRKVVEHFGGLDVLTNDAGVIQVGTGSRRG